MLAGLSLRLRIFLFFCLLALGGLAVTTGALFAGYTRANAPELLNAFVFSGLLSGFALLALVAAVWLLFDEHVAKPIERLASEMRARAHAGVCNAMDLDAARYLGDLAPAAQAVAGQLSQTALATAQAVALETAQLAAERDRLTALLTDIPIAMMILSPTHKIVLYDGQAAAVLAQMGHPRLHASLFDYIQPGEIKAAYAKLCDGALETRCTAISLDASQRYDVRLKSLGATSGYILMFDDSHAEISPQAARPLVYDFDLLDTTENAAVDDRKVSDLCFVVFDTETTGLLPHKDEVVQIGAVRVLRGRIIETEVLDLLVDPGIPIPAGSTKVHGVTDAMVAGAPSIDAAGRALHQFATDAVIVAHNAPFDMAFLRRHASSMGVTWDQPILDTVLISAVVFGASAPHTLDALCDRLGVVIPEAERHTALGDARATAQVLCKMLPMLEARGMYRFDDVIDQTRKHGRLLEDLN